MYKVYNPSKLQYLSEPLTALQVCITDIKISYSYVYPIPSKLALVLIPHPVIHDAGERIENLC